MADNEDNFDVVIVGGGHGGAQVAISLRQQGYEGSIALLTDEPDLPYERPPLSKEYLADEKSFERILIRPELFWADRGIEVRTNSEVVRVEPLRKRLTTASGQIISYGQLIWAAGGRARTLSCPGADLRAVHTVRSRQNVDEIKSTLSRVSRIVVVGGGYIGLEAAAVFSKLGKPVTVLEAQERVLARVAGEPLSRFFESEHRAHGVDIKLNSTVDAILGDQDVQAVRLSDGEIIPCEMVIVGIGIIPSVAPLVAAGATGSNGVDVDAHCRTSLANIYAIGDCAAHRNWFAGGRQIRLESVQNAADQAAVVAQIMSGKEATYEAVPWFWSNQYDLKLQTVGLSNGHDQVIIRGEPAERSFSIIYLRETRVIALDCVNATRDYVQGRKLVEAGARADPAALSDPNIPLKSLVELA